LQIKSASKQSFMPLDGWATHVLSLYSCKNIKKTKPRTKSNCNHIIMQLKGLIPGAAKKELVNNIMQVTKKSRCKSRKLCICICDPILENCQYTHTSQNCFIRFSLLMGWPSYSLLSLAIMETQHWKADQANKLRH